MPDPHPKTQPELLNWAHARAAVGPKTPATSSARRAAPVLCPSFGRVQDLVNHGRPPRGYLLRAAPPVEQLPVAGVPAEADSTRLNLEVDKESPQS